MKKNLILFATLSLIYFSARNEQGIHISSFELIITGYDQIKEKINLYNTFLNIASMLIYISLLESSLSSRFKLRNYIAARGGFSKVSHCLMKVSIINIFTILVFKQLLYTLFFLISLSYTTFYIYDMLSTLLTLTFFSLILITMKIHGVRGAYAIFALSAVNILSQIISIETPIFSIFIIGTADWNEIKIFVYLYKIIFIILMFYFVLLVSKSNKIKEVFVHND